MAKFRVAQQQLEVVLGGSTVSSRLKEKQSKQTQDGQEDTQAAATHAALCEPEPSAMLLTTNGS